MLNTGLLRYLGLALILGLSVQLRADKQKKIKTVEEKSISEEREVQLDATLTDVSAEDRLVPLRSGIFYPEQIVSAREKNLFELRSHNSDAYAYLIGLCKGNVGLLSEDNKTLLIKLGFLKWDGSVFEDVKEVVRAGSPRKDTIFEWQSPISEQ